MRPTASHALVIGAFLAFSLMPLFTREASAPVLGLVAWRAVLVAIVFAAWTAAREGGVQALAVDRRTLRVGSVYGIALAVASSSFVGGYAMTTVANTVFLHNLAPAMAFPLAWWAFRERPAAEAVTGALVAIVGVGLMSGVSIFQFSQFAHPRFLLGDLSALLSAVGYAAVLVITRRARMLQTPLLATLFVAWSVAALLLSALALALDTMAMPAQAWPWVLGLALVCTNLPFFLLNLGMRALPAGLTSVLSMSEVVFTTLLGVAVYDERLAPIGWLGAGLVAVGLVYPLVTRSDADVTPHEEPDESDAMATPADSTDTPRADDEATDAQAAATSTDTDAVASASDSAPPPPPAPPRSGPTPPPPMDPGSSPWRGLRLGLFLLVFNAGAAGSLLSGQAAATLVAWIGLLGLLRLGLRPAGVMLEGRLSRTLRAGAGLAALACVVGALQAVGAAGPGSPALAALLAAVALLDRKLAAREAEADRDRASLVSGALLILALAWLPAAAAHPADRWLTALAALGAALAGATVLLAALGGDPTHARMSGAPGVDTLDALGPRLAAPRVSMTALTLAFFAGGLHVVPTGHQVVVERLGYPLPDPADAGLHLRLPPPLERVVLVDVDRVRSESIVDQGATLLCGDQSMLSAEGSLQWRVADARAFAYAVTDPSALLSDLGHAALVEAVAHLGVDEVLTTGRAALEQQVAAQAQEAADAAGLGVRIEGVHIATAAVPPPVTDAFLDVISAEEEKRTAINEAEAYAADVLPRTRGEALGRIEQSQGEAARIEARADADFAEFAALVEGGARAPALIRFGLAHDRLAAALAPARITLLSPRLRAWVGDGVAHPLRIDDDGHRSSP